MAHASNEMQVREGRWRGRTGTASPAKWPVGKHRGSKNVWKAYSPAVGVAREDFPKTWRKEKLGGGEKWVGTPGRRDVPFKDQNQERQAVVTPG